MSSGRKLSELLPCKAHTGCSGTKSDAAGLLFQGLERITKSLVLFLDYHPDSFNNSSLILLSVRNLLAPKIINVREILSVLSGGQQVPAVLGVLFSPLANFLLLKYLLFTSDNLCRFTSCC